MEWRRLELIYGTTLVQQLVATAQAMILLTLISYTPPSLR